MSDYKPPRRLPSNLDPGSESGAQIMLDGALSLIRLLRPETLLGFGGLSCNNCICKRLNSPHPRIPYYGWCRCVDVGW
jgi:hypothetical protein